MQSPDNTLKKLRNDLSELMEQWNKTIQIQTHLFSKINEISSQLDSIFSQKNEQPLSPMKSPSTSQNLDNNTANSSTQDIILDSGALLSTEQQAVCELVKSKKNVFFTGSAGTGKSFLLRHIISMLHGKSIAVTASTGIAASLVGGTTLHKFSGVGVPTVMEDFGRMWSKRDTWRSLDCLIIDEISMVSGEFFSSLEKTVCEILEDPRPFGGIQIICCGDFCQLPPVFKYLSNERKNTRQELSKSVPFEQTMMCFESEAWKKCDFQVCHLTKVFRQVDPQFVKILQELRIGVVSPQCERLLEGCNIPLSEDDGIKPTVLYPKKANVQKENQKQLMLLRSQPMMVFKAVDCIAPDEFLSERKYEMAIKELHDTEFFKNCQAPEFLELKVGAQVMLVKNLSDSFVNGSRGVILKWVSVDTLNLMLEFQDKELDNETNGLLPCTANSNVLIIDSNGVIHKPTNHGDSIANNNNNNNIKKENKWKPPLSVIKKMKYPRLDSFPGTVVNENSTYEEFVRNTYGLEADDSDNENDYMVFSNGTPCSVPREDLYVIDDFVKLPREKRRDIMEFVDPQQVEILQQLAILGRCYDPHVPLVRFVEDRERILPAAEFKTEISGAGFCYRFQVPLMLAWALTIHKCQGLTLDKAEMDLSGVFASGHAYVAIRWALSVKDAKINSRVRSLKGMYLKGFKRDVVKADRKVLEFYGVREKINSSYNNGNGLNGGGKKRYRSKENDTCFKCNQKGHWATDCTQKNARRT